MMEKLWPSIESLFEKLTTNDIMLTRLEFFTVVIALLLLIMFILDSYRNRSRHPALKIILLVLDTIANSTVTYTVGLMQFAPFENDLVQVWAVLLTILYESCTNCLSAYSLKDQDNRRRRELSDMVNSFFVAYLNATRGTWVKVILWLLWSANTLKIIHRIVAFEFATRSHGVGRNSRLVADYMCHEHEMAGEEEPDATTMRGYKYLVLGEAQQKVEAKAPEYTMSLVITREKKLITLDKVWQCEGKLLISSGDAGRRLKDVCLSFALFKLLRRRFDNMHALPELQHPKAKDLVLRGLLGGGGDGVEENHERAFRVIEAELAFINDYFHTRYPIIFCYGFPVFNVLLFLIVFGASLWLAGLLLTTYRPPPGSFVHIMDGVNVDLVITLVVLGVIILKEAWEIVIYLLSIWAKVVLICKYVELPTWQSSFFVEILLGFICKLTVMKPWHNQLGQYSLLESYRYSPSRRNALSYMTLWLFSEGREGAKKGKPILLPAEVKKAVLVSLHSLASSPNLIRLSSRCEGSSFSWACSLDTYTHTVLVWHIATSICEMQLFARVYGKLPTGKDQTFDVELKRLDGELRVNYTVAKSLSRYCTYLLVFSPELLPDRSFATESIFKEAVDEVRNYLQRCVSIQGVYDRMMSEGRGVGVVEKGAELARQLIRAAEEEEDGERAMRWWKEVADFWSEMILYLAPSSNVEAHESCLATGGEFITHLWALLSHVGILEQPEAP